MTEPPDWRSGRWEATHRRIYETALTLFQQQGFERVSVAQIASAAAVSVPTFYAHFASKEHLVMQVPTAEDMQKIMAAQPPDLPPGERVRRAVPLWHASWTPEMREEALTRWKVIAATPALRLRAAEFERATAGLIAEAMPDRTGSAVPPGDAIVVNAYLAAYTAALLAWADADGERKLEELVDEAFDALEQ